MAPPSYADLGKKASDIHSKGFHPGTFKLEAKTKTDSGVKITTNGQKDIESGKVLAGSELTFAWPDYGLKYVEKWNTDNQLTADISIEDKVIQGLKTSFITSFNPSSNKKKGTLKTSFKQDYVNTNLDVDLDYAGPIMKSSMVCGYKGWFAGFQMSLNASKASLTGNELSLSYDDAGAHIATATVKNGQDFSGSYYHRLSEKFEAGALLQWSSANAKSTAAAVGVQFNGSPDTTMKMKVSMDGVLGLSLQQKVTDSMSLTLSSILDTKNISTGGHRVGASLEFET